ncbi:hypothetical protein JIG36_47460 [Actinoplanes sp. LDG1-06]|uniref:Uncharacterized protein n=1 Tax=Paractinoplanes ovalisporus TaxID=2810368 RepID=A0ABS2ATM5_9ACTN|nr:hypothetical protein [Actinoplanes ovalisporus]MBM2623161.1 hypothetical protein [Actinoplanes ovalisporus]
MSRTDADLVAVRDLPPGVTEPSDESLARVWARIAARPAPRPRSTARRLWVPITAAAAVLVLVGVGVLMLRPRQQSLPSVTRLTSDPATVTRVIGELSDATRAVPQQPVADGQLFYMRTRPVSGARACESWLRPADLGSLYRQCGESDVPAETRAGADANMSGWDEYDPARPGGWDVSAGEYIDPAAIRAQFILLRNDLRDASDNLRIWTGLQSVVWPGRFLPVDRRVALHQVMARLPLSVGETEQDGNRLVVVRFAEAGVTSDLLFDPGTGLPVGWETTRSGSAQASIEPEAEASHEPYVVSGDDQPAPTESGRVLRSIDVVEGVGDRP